MCTPLLLGSRFGHSIDEQTINAGCLVSAHEFSTERPDSDRAKCVASTEHLSNAASGFRAARFTADGTSIIAEDGARHLRTFVLPSNLLEEGQNQPHTLVPHVNVQSPSPVRSFSAYPGFSLQDPSTTLVLSSRKDLPLVLHNAVYNNGVEHARYSLVNQMTEAYIAPTSLLWTFQGSHFVAGCDNRLSIFDASRNNEGPILTHEAPRKKGLVTVDVSRPQCRGLVTSLSASSDGVLAAGTSHRQITLISNQGCGDYISSFYLENDAARGTGIMQLSWSTCGKFLFVAERQSDCVQIYDMRNTHMRVGCLVGRKADTTQRMGIEVVTTEHGSQIWAGGTDGFVRMWKDPGLTEDEQRPDLELQMHNDAVPNVIWHPSANVFATCTERNRMASDGHDHESELSSNDEATKIGSSSTDSALKVWSWI